MFFVFVDLRRDLRFFGYFFFDVIVISEGCRVRRSEDCFIFRDVILFFYSKFMCVFSIWLGGDIRVRGVFRVF